MQFLEFMEVCLQNCDIIESSFCALYIILDVGYIPSIDSLPGNRKLREQANICIILLSFFAMCSVTGPVYQFCSG
jgi:hypothetical protein